MYFPNYIQRNFILFSFILFIGIFFVFLHINLNDKIMTAKKQVKTVNVPNDLDLDIQKYQTAQMEKGNKKPTVKDIVTVAIRKFLESEK